MTKLKRSISILLMILTLSSVFSMNLISASASTNGNSPSSGLLYEDIDMSDGIKYVKVNWSYDGNGTLTFTGNGKVINYYDELNSDSLYKEIKSIGKYVKHIKLAEGITGIELPLKNLPKIETIDFSSSVKYIDTYVFQDCKTIKSVTLPEKITRIDDNSFNGCSNLITVNLPSTLKSIGWRAFSDCKKLKNITIPESVTKIDDSAFSGCESLTAITLPEKIDVISDWLFDGCKNLKTINYSKNLRVIGLGAFTDCKSLESFTFPSYMNIIQKDTFSGCTNLKKITIPKNVTKIAQSAFEGCVNLTSVKLSSDTTAIGTKAFKDCTGLTSFTIPNKVTLIRQQAFDGCKNIKTFNISKNVNEIGKNVFINCTNLKSINVDKNNKKYATVNGSLYNKKKNNLIAYPGGRTSSYKVSKGTKYIGNQSFSGATVKKVVLPNTVKNIGYKAFENCKNLNNITIPSSVSFIDAKVFDNTKYYNTSKYWYKGQLYVANCVVDSKEDIKSADLKSGTRLIAKEAYYNRKNLKSVKLSNKLQYINDRAFLNCNKVKSAVLPKSIKYVGKKAIGYKITTVYADVDSFLEYYQRMILARDDFTLYVYKNTAGNRYAKGNAFNYKVIK